MPALHPDDLIDDRALRSADQDAFRHVDFVQELAEVARATRTPANFALYAPWGSGKTGMAYLLENEFRCDSKVRFVRFDAFKYAEAPLRRHFIAQVAGDLGLPEESYKDALYSNETHTTLKLPAREVWRLAAWFVAALVMIVGLALIGCLIYGRVARGEFADQFHNATKWLMPKVFAPGALIAAIVAVVGKRFTYDRTISAPASEEEFEERFEALVKDAVGLAVGDKDEEKTVDDSKRRLVVFVDELDRCSPAEVVATLETLWTFFDVTGCVFIVAADQQVLEEALSRKARQATPKDSTNPYYSAGSAYLDKIFHYQQSLPPLKPQRLTSFGLGLVEEREGVWHRISQQTDLADVISILVPSHVRSPRRVKALLNAFAMLYRIAEQRATDEVLGDIGPRIPELAKLTCLRVEFPLFAADLAQEPRMPEYVLLASEGDPFPAHVPEHIEERARRWEQGKLAVDRLISHGDPGADDEVNFDDDEDRDQETGRDDNAAVRTEHANQLVAYLSKSRAIPGPGRDLIYLESAGFEVGLDPGVADDLEVAAVDGRRAQVRRIVERLEGEDQLRAYKLLAHLARHSTIGLEGQNTIGALMEALAAHKLPLAPIADEVCAAIAHQSYELAESDLGGALALSLESEHRGAKDLREKVVTDERTIANQGLALVMVRSVERIGPRYSDYVARALYVVAIADPDSAAEAVNGAPASAITTAMDEMQGELPRMIEAEEEVTEEALANLVRALDALLDAPDERTVIAEGYASALLRTQIDSLIDAVDARLSKLSAGTHHGFARALLTGATDQETARAIRWFEAVDPRQMPKLGDVTKLVDPLLLAVWTDAADGTLTNDDLTTAVGAARRFAEAGNLDRCQQTEATVNSNLQATVTSEAEGEHREELFEAASELAESGCLSAETVADSALEMAAASFATHGNVSGELVDGILDIVERFSADASAEAVEAFFTGGIATTWQGAAQSARLIVAVDRRDHSPVEPGEVASLASNPYFERGLAVWLIKFASEVDDTLAAITPIKSDPPSDRIRAALTEHCEWWLDEDPAAHEEFVRRMIAAAPQEPTDAGFASAALVTKLSVDTVIDALIEAGEQATHADEVRRVFDLLPATTIDSQPDVDRILQGLFVPLAQRQTEEDVRLAIDYVSWLKKGSQSVRNSTRRALRNAADHVSMRGELEDALKQSGLSRKKGPFGLGGREDL